MIYAIHHKDRQLRDAVIVDLVIAFMFGKLAPGPRQETLIQGTLVENFNSVKQSVPPPPPKKKSGTRMNNYEFTETNMHNNITVQKHTVDYCMFLYCDIITSIQKRLMNMTVEH